MDSPEIEEFELYVDLTVSILHTQDRQITGAFREGINQLLEPEYVSGVMTAALCYLAEIDPGTFRWALHNYDSALTLELRRKVSVWAAQQLIEKGLVPGRDFSSLPEAGMLIRTSAKTELMKQAGSFIQLMLAEILHIYDPTHHQPVRSF